jgi:hypothetical protein
MWTTLENKKKTATHFLRSVLKRKNKVEEGGALGSRMKSEQESTNLRAQKMMRGRMEPSAVPIVVHAAKHTTKIPQMVIPHETQLREQR